MRYDVDFMSGKNCRKFRTMKAVKSFLENEAWTFYKIWKVDGDRILAAWEWDDELIPLEYNGTNDWNGQWVRK